MDEENKQVTADEVYSYGESTEEPADRKEGGTRAGSNRIRGFTG